MGPRTVARAGRARDRVGARPADPLSPPLHRRHPAAAHRRAGGGGEGVGAGPGRPGEPGILGLRPGPPTRARPGSSWRSPTTAAGSGWSSSTRPGGPSSCRSGPWPCSSGPSAPTGTPSSSPAPRPRCSSWPAPRAGTAARRTEQDGEPLRGRVYPGLPPDRQGQAHVGPASAGSSARPSTGPGTSPIRWSRPGGTASAWSTGPRPSTTSTARAPRTRPSRPAAGWPSTSCSGCSSPWCCARPGCSATPGASATWSTGRRETESPTLVEQFLDRPALRAHPGPTGRHGGHPIRPGRAAAHAPPAAGGRGLGQDGGGPGRHAHRQPGGPPGRPDGPDRGAGRAARRGGTHDCWRA